MIRQSSRQASEDVVDRIEIYRGKGLTKGQRGWRWRYIAAGNQKRLANGNESYNNQDDALEGMRRVCGLPTPIPGQDGWQPLTGAVGETSWRVSRYEDNSILVVIQQ
jgi:hypothetical protein